MDDDANQLPRIVGLNHIALEVNDIEEALRFYGELFDVRLRGRGDKRAFIDLGDQFIALLENRERAPDQDRHFGLVVDDKETVRVRLNALNIELIPGPFLDFRDPSGNRIQIIDYTEVQFTKAPEVLRGMDLAELSKSSKAQKQLREKSMAAD